MKASKFFARGVVVAVLLACFADPALAQRVMWGNDERFRAYLGLTPEQRAPLADIFQKTQPVRRQRMLALDAAEEEFDRRVENGDDSSVMDYVGTVETARAELNKTRTVMLLRMRRSLTADQWAKFTALADQRRQRTPPRRQR
jgi:Spy/CpxP family protein refolding chaperone